MSLQRRLTLYLIGLILGGMMAYKFYGDRVTNGKWLPENKVKQRLTCTLIAVLRDFDLDTTATLQRIVLVQ